MRAGEAIATSEPATDEDNGRDDQRDDASRDEPPDPRAEPNYYAVLGVSPSIDGASLAAVYRMLLKKFHPDV